MLRDILRGNYFFIIKNKNQHISLYLLIKNQNQYEKNLSKDINNVSGQDPARLYILDNTNFINNNPISNENKSQDNSNNMNDINHNNNIINRNSNTTKNMNKNELIANSIDDKYKNLENPFTTPEIPKKVETEEKRARIMDRINKGRKKGKSQSFEKEKYKKSEEIQKLADKLGEHLFKDKEAE